MTTQQSILHGIGITDTQTQNDIINGTKRLVILDASAHLDWDWLLPNPVLVTGGKNNRSRSYFKGPGVAAPNDPGVEWSNQILEKATGMLANPAYHYSDCEMGFLRGTAITDPETFKRLASAWEYKTNVRFPGGGIASPDNLLPHGEAINEIKTGSCGK